LSRPDPLPIGREAWFPAVVAGAACISISACATAPLSPYTADTPPLVLVPAQQAGVSDKRARFREIFCAVLEAHGYDLPDYRPCEEALTRVGAEPAGTGTPVDLGPSRRRLIAGFVPGLGWECIAGWLQASGSIAAHVRRFGYEVKVLEVNGLSGTGSNARRIRDAILQMQLSPHEARRLVLIGYSKGAPDILEAVAGYPEIRDVVAAVVSAAGAVGGSPLANRARQSQLDLLRRWPGAKCEQGDGLGIDSLRPDVRRAWLAANPLPRDFPYYSLVTYPHPDRISGILRGSYDELSQVDARNDSQLVFYDQVIPGSALAAYLNADHWALTLPINRSHPWIASMFVTHNAYPREALLEALLRLVEEDLEALEQQPGRP
jgi:hypothetical protein